MMLLRSALRRSVLLPATAASLRGADKLRAVTVCRDVGTAAAADDGEAPAVGPRERLLAAALLRVPSLARVAADCSRQPTGGRPRASPSRVGPPAPPAA